MKRILFFTRDQPQDNRPQLIFVNDSVEIPKRRHFFHHGRAAESVESLPDYKSPALSRSNPFAIIDCHKALETSIYEARLIGFEIARKRPPKKDRLLRRSITLEGDQRNLDMIFSSTTEEINFALSITPIQDLYLMQCRLGDVLENLLKAHKDFKSSSGNHPPSLKEY